MPDINIGVFLNGNPYFIYRGPWWGNMDLKTFIREYKIYPVFPGGDRLAHRQKGTICARYYGTIFEIGISRISSAPYSLSFGMSWLTAFFCTTVWML